MRLFLAATLVLARHVTSILLSSAPARRDIAASCTDPKQRIPWTVLTEEEKTSYIHADLCLMSSPSKSGVPGAVSRWDDLQWAHIVQTIPIHSTGVFLPFHRYYVTVHEHLIRDECGYNGRLPYWDELADNSDASEMFLPQYFGGNGEGEGGCITDGPFVNLTLRFERNYQVRDHCLTRRFDTGLLDSRLPAGIDQCNAMGNFSTAWPCWADYPHLAGHAAIGGIMSDATFSPGDPIFYLHHGFLDKLWWDWQNIDYPARLNQIAGENNPFEPGDPDYPPHNITDYYGDNGPLITLNHTLWVNGLLPNVTIGDVMDLNGPTICAEFLSFE